MTATSEFTRIIRGKHVFSNRTVLRWKRVYLDRLTWMERSHHACCSWNRGIRCSTRCVWRGYAVGVGEPDCSSSVQIVERIAELYPSCREGYCRGILQLWQEFCTRPVSYVIMSIYVFKMIVEWIGYVYMYMIYGNR